MQRELEELLALQESDLRISDLDGQLEALSPRIRELEHRKGDKQGAAARVDSALKIEERRQHDIQRRVAQHTLLQERNTAQMDTVRNMREAGAASTQLEVTKRIIAEDEQELRATEARIAELQGELDRVREEVAQIDMDIELAQAEIAESRTALEEQLGTARAERETRATGISRPLLGKYDRIRGRRARALYPLRGPSCGHCDTAVPLHRRSQMQSSGGIEVCEACGVLLYVTAPA